MKTLGEKEWYCIKEKSDSIKEPFFKLFKIRCLKCNSNDVEIFGDYDSGGCYYAGDSATADIVIKCHCCGNAKVFNINGKERESISGEE